MSTIPRDPAFDSTLALLREGYDFIWSRCRRFESDIFLTRVMGKRAVCIHGREAAELFYDESKLQRRGAVPRRVVTSLFGKGGVQTLDDAAHRQRKSAFLALTSLAQLDGMLHETARQWSTAIARWQKERAVVLFDEAAHVLTRAACAWAGVPLPKADVQRRASDFVAMVDAFGGAGPRLWRGKLARSRAEAWMERLVEDVRTGDLRVAEGCVLGVMSRHEDERGALLPARTAAVEVLNIIRPTVAVSWYITFAALALHEHPELRDELARAPLGAASTAAQRFALEVRRFYPFAPFLGAKVRAPFEWRGHQFQPGTLVLLDVYGTNHDPHLWEAPDEFRPRRFEQWSEDLYSFIPHGGGHPATGHRCPGEAVTTEQLVLALHVLARCVTFESSHRDLSFDRARMPTRPKSGFRMEAIKATGVPVDAAWTTIEPAPLSASAE